MDYFVRVDALVCRASRGRAMVRMMDTVDSLLDGTFACTIHGSSFAKIVHEGAHSHTQNPN